MLYNCFSIIIFIAALFTNGNFDQMIKLMIVSGMFAIAGSLWSTLKSFFDAINGVNIKKDEDKLNEK